MEAIGFIALGSGTWNGKIWRVAPVLAEKRIPVRAEGGGLYLQLLPIVDLASDRSAPRKGVDNKKTNEQHGSWGESLIFILGPATGKRRSQLGERPTFIVVWFDSTWIREMMQGQQSEPPQGNLHHGLIGCFGGCSVPCFSEGTPPPSHTVG